MPFQPCDKFVEILGSADAFFATIGSGLENLALPSRTFTFLSAGRPIITIMNPEADLAKMILIHDWVLNVSNAEELKSLMEGFSKNCSELQTKCQRARQVYKKYFKKEKLIKEYADFIADVGQS